MSTFRNLVQNAMRRKNLLVLADKAVSRARESQRGGSEAVSSQWCAAHETSIEDFANKLDPALWQEAVDFADAFAVRGKSILSKASVRLGGPGAYHLLYFLTRMRRPKTVVETGVAAGWSSAAFLHALSANGDDGRLYSSDFPYFRQQDPEKGIGILVDDDLRAHWQLRIDGDKVNLPKIMHEVESVDLFHYDSDKTYAGRDYGLKTVMPKLSKGAVVIFDDIQQNTHFKDRFGVPGKDFYVFKFASKYLGLVIV